MKKDDYIFVWLNAILGVFLIILPFTGFITNKVAPPDFFMCFLGGFFATPAIYKLKGYNNRKLLLVALSSIILAGILWGAYIFMYFPLYRYSVNIMVFMVIVLVVVLIALFAIFFITDHRKIRKFNKTSKLANEGKYLEAIAYFDEYLKSNPDDPIAWINKAFTLQMFGNYDEALECCNTALNFKDNNNLLSLKKHFHALILFVKGLVLFSLKRYEEALKYADETLRLNKRIHGAWNLKGIALSELGNYEESIEYYDKAISRFNSKVNVVAFSNKSEAFRLLGKYQEALECIDKSLKITSKIPFLWINKGLALEKLGNYEEALECYNTVLKLYPEQKPGQLPELLASCNRSLEIEPEEAAWWFNKGVILGTLEKNQEALKCLDKVLELDPRFGPAKKAKGEFGEIINKN